MRARDNPFRVERLHALEYRFGAGDDLERLVARLRARGGRGALVGPHGSGKTTLLERLARRLADDGLDVRALRIGAERRALTRAELASLTGGVAGDVAVLLDGAGHLLPWQWWRVRAAARPAGFLVVTAHRAGRLPVALRTTPSAALLRELTAALGCAIEPDDAAALLRRCRGNVRDALRALYDRHAG